MNPEEGSYGHYARKLSKDEYNRISTDQTVSDWIRNRLEIDAKRNWDKFYLRNQTNFFKNRHWTKKEFEELKFDLQSEEECLNKPSSQKILLELGCGCGNFMFPLIEEKTNFYVFATDFSPRAINFIKSNKLYDESKCKAFVADITDENFDEQFKKISENKLVDLISLIFVLSSINPEKMKSVLINCFKVLKPSGKVLIRDYGLYDQAQLRFKQENKISENFYTRADGTRAFYFSEQFLLDLGKSVGFDVIENKYVLREMINRKQGICVPRIFIQSKFVKPIDSSKFENCPI